MLPSLTINSEVRQVHHRHDFFPGVSSDRPRLRTTSDPEPRVAAVRPRSDQPLVAARAGRSLHAQDTTGPEAGVFQAYLKVVKTGLLLLPYFLDEIPGCLKIYIDRFFGQVIYTYCGIILLALGVLALRP